MKERDETRERFLAAIADKLPAERIIEAHLFQPIRQSGFESGVGVVAVDEQPNIRGEAAAENPIRAEGAAENTVVGAAENAAIGAAENHRLAVYTAKYRLSLKGAERGKWEFADPKRRRIAALQIRTGKKNKESGAASPHSKRRSSWPLQPPPHPRKGVPAWASSSTACCRSCRAISPS